MWYKTARPFIESGELALVGVVQEQHAERAQLYRQWKQFDFPILQDATTQLNLAVVPVPILIDQHGIVRNTRPRPNQLASFVAEDYAAGDNQQSSKPDAPSTQESVDQWIEKGNKSLNSPERDLEAAIASFEKAVAEEPANGKALFSLGVAYRMRYDSPSAQVDDFTAASKYWSQALAVNPNQYIWRRRIQQYGPRQIKPYPFYDWVDTAIAEVKARGESPVVLTVPLSGAEVAQPARRFQSTSETVSNPDPENKIHLEDQGRVEMHSAIVPATIQAGKSARVHLTFSLEKGKWNNEGGPLEVWIDKSNAVTPQQQLIQLPANKGQESDESRSVDFEIKTKADVERCEVTGYALFHLCDDDGVCYYLRKNFSVPMTLQTTQK